MIRCRICSSEMPDTARFCCACAAPVGVDASSTTCTLPPATTPTPGEGRFAPGLLLASRYRILGLAGRGGMGEVYRAHDRKLDQVVALKFLPEALRQNPAALVRLHGEVRIARQISHPNVCRVYDIGEAEGLHFLTMEYIDGEDLARLLRRIGRFPHDKGVEIARKLCAALAAAHDRGVLHRDLKPSNIMLNTAGQVLVTDFGLAVVAAQLEGGDAASGTPAYMAPEQLDGREVSVRSDVYSLGLVLYEIFTGKRAFEGRKHGDLMNPSSVAKDIDLAVERVILRCLAERPGDRPPTALSVAMALPGGDPLEAALAAGETPSPEMVAAAGAEAGISVRAAVLCFVGVVVCLLAWLLVGDRLQIAGSTSLELPPEALAARAREIAASLGYTARPLNRAFGLAYDTEYIRHLRNKPEPGPIRERRPTPVYFWYRESPWLLAPLGIDGVKFQDPPAAMSGMLAAFLDSAGRLMLFQAVPIAHQPAAQSRNTDWSALFAAAGLEISSFNEVQPEWVPPMFSDCRKAWKGAYPNQADSPVRVEAASLEGRPVYFRIVAPWVAEAPGSEPAATVGPAFATVPANPFAAAVWGGVTLLACWLAWQNIRRGRGDRRGAFRFAAFVFVVQLVLRAAIGDLDHAFTFPVRVLLAVGTALYLAFTAWVIYTALEPLVRRTWPQSLVSWSRMLGGRLRDPLLGRDVLVGILAGCATFSLVDLELLVYLSQRGYAFNSIGAPLPSGNGWLIGHLARALTVPVLALLVVVAFSVLWALLRRRWAAAAGTYVILASLLVRGSSVALGPVVAWMAAGLVCVALVAVLVHSGVTALAAAICTAYLMSYTPRGLDLSAWHQTPGRIAAAFLLLLAFYGLHCALAGRRVIGSRVLGE